MNPQTTQRLDEMFFESPIMVGGPVPDEEVDQAERRVGMRFDPDYREFIGRYGGAMIGSLPVFGLRQAEVMGDESVVDVTARFRADRWPSTEQWLIVSMDQGGNPIGLTAAGEIWISDHEAHETRSVARTFEDFVVQLLDNNERGLPLCL